MTNAPIHPKYSIGIAEMDAQHAHWIALIDEFRTAASGQLLEQAGINAAKHALEQLLEYTRHHFASEERYIAAHNYPGFAAHKQHHEELVAEVVKLHDEILAHKTRTTPLKLNLFVTIWLMEHIMKDDDKYARFILGKDTAAQTPHHATGSSAIVAPQ